ncbi:PhoU domain-containing protein [Desulfocurvibacter africanus]|uniref:Phosphate uptake regulator, PhoU n=1 Tax=Desulfocurvibacter africanus subsp. africanus str. Walvis Bay TaxID=690850 RepID=F3YX14_DESAF|nr:PhoU domain-containing protein [Desulfocurvibacter africanus]EGJ49402.1 phosphate uptake regulator, PhoU [Desulfocurvibacter africanus subsp. africanus str. Walvis Bay]
MKVLEENFRFMILEVMKQVESTLRLLDTPGTVSIESIESRDDYIDNLKSVIENDCFSHIHRQPLGKRNVDRIRALNVVTSNLERLADHCVNVARQTPHLSEPAFFQKYDYRPFFQEVLTALDRVHPALTRQDMSLAFKICRAEFTLDSMYKQQFDRILGELRSGSETGNLVTTLFIFRYLERMGDALLNVGEAIIFSITGDKFKIHQYNALRETLGSRGEDAVPAHVEFESIWGTRSGCRIGKVNKPQDDEKGVKQSLIFKEGNRKKLLQEKASIERWEAIMPGLPPKVQALQEEGASVSLLIEYLGGCTFQDLVLTAEHDVLENALFLVTQTVSELWEATLKKQPAPASFMRQALARMTDVYHLHPDFQTGRRAFCGIVAPSTDALMERASELCGRVASPFTVFIHGDFNINNIVYSHETQRIHYIDLHRSTDSDYLQDVSVFLVSNYRLPIFSREARERIDYVSAEFLRFARAFAKRHGDTTFEARLCLGLARSFITSTRFELNKRFAKSMLLRGVYLLEKVLAHEEERPLEEFRLPDAVLSY